MNKRKLTAVLLLIVCVLSTNCIVVSAEEDGIIGIAPYLSNLSKLKGNLRIASGSAECKGNFQSNNTKKKVITVTLQKKSGNGWATVDSWKKTSTGTGTITLSKKRNVAKNNKYRVKAYVEVFNGSGAVIERAADYSAAVSY